MWPTVNRWLREHFVVVVLILFCAAILLSKTFAPAPEPVEGAPISTVIEIIDQPRQKNDKWVFTGKSRPHGQRLLISWREKDGAYQPEYGDVINVSGLFSFPGPPRNPGQFDYRNYLLQKNIDGVFQAKEIHLTEKRFGNPLKRLAYFLKNKILAINKQTLPHPYSDLYTGLVFGEHGTHLPDDMSEGFQKAGLTHLLVVSGSQVALLTGILAAIFRVIGLSRPATFWCITGCNLLFYFVTGGGSSIFRAILMNEVALGVSLMYRRTNIYHVVSLTALIMLLINPMTLFDVGAQLSFMATFSLLFAAPRLAERLPKSLPNWARETLSVSLAPFLLTEPILIANFHTISLVSLISNIIVISWIEILVVVGFFSTLIGFIFLPLTQVLNNFSLIIMVLLNKLVQFVTSFQHAVIHVTPSPFLVIVAFILIIFCIQSAKHVRYGIYGLSIVLFLLIVPALLPNRHLKVTFLDVGQGDAAIIETPNHKTILVDTGLDQRVVIPALIAKGVNKIDLIVLTHFHIDHMGGLPYILKEFPVGSVIDNGNGKISCNHRIRAVSGQRIKLDKDLTLHIYFPEKNFVTDENENNNSVVCKLTYGKIDFLLMGDLEHEKEERLLSLVPRDQLQCEVLKLGHHGSQTSSSEAFIRTVRPVFGIVSAGIRNRYHHPSKSTLERMEANHIQVLRTDLQGALEFETNGKKLFYKTYL